MQMEVEVAPLSPVTPSPPPLLHDLSAESGENSAPPGQSPRDEQENTNGRLLGSARENEGEDRAATNTADAFASDAEENSSQTSPVIPSVVDVLNAKGSARARLLSERRELLLEKGDVEGSRGRAKRTRAKVRVRRSLLAEKNKSPMKRSQANALRAMR